MKVRIPRDYLTLPEVQERWGLPPGSLDLHRAILKAIVRPSLFLSDELAMALPGGPLQTGERSPVHGLVYVQCLRQTGAFDCVVSAVSYARDPVDDGALFLLDRPLSMADLFAQAVVMREDVEAAEQLAASGQDLSTKERGSLLKMLSILAFEAYRCDPQQRSNAAAQISEAGAGMGLGISEGTALKFLRMAFAEYPPGRRPSAIAVRAAQLPHA